MFKFIVASNELKGLLDMASSVIVSKSVLPILSNVLVQAKDGNYFAVGSSSENELTVPFTTLRVTEGRFADFCISPDVSKVLGTLSVQTLTVTIDNGNAKVEYENGEFDVPVDGSENFPRIQPIHDESRKVAFDAESADLFPTMSKAVACVNRGDSILPIRSALLLDAVNDGYVIVGTNGYKLLKRSTLPGVPFLKSGAPTQLLIPQSVIRALSNAFANVDTVHIEADNRVSHFYSDAGVSMYITMIEGHYPNYNAVIPQNQDYHVIVNLNALVAALKRVVLFSSTESSLISLSCEKDSELSIQSRDLDFSRAGKETIFCQECNIPNGFVIGLKGTDFINVVSLTAAENVCLMMSDPSRAITIKEDDPKSSLVLLQMPLVLPENM